MVKVYKKENGFTIEADGNREIVVEGKDPKKVGAAVLMAFAKPRTYKKRAEKAA